MPETTLCRWMAAYGSQEYHANKLRVYKPSLKRSVLRAIESGMSITEAERTRWESLYTILTGVPSTAAKIMRNY